MAAHWPRPSLPSLTIALNSPCLPGLAIAHQTGYPLYTLLGKLFSLAVPANVAWAVNLLSAVAGALTVGLVYLVGRQLTRRRLPALLGAVALAASPVFWSQAVIAEVYTLNSAFVAAMLWLALRWARDPWRPVTPFSLLQGAPQAADASLSERRNRWLRLSPRVRNLADRLGAAYRRLFPLYRPSAAACFSRWLMGWPGCTA